MEDFQGAKFIFWIAACRPLRPRVGDFSPQLGLLYLCCGEKNRLLSKACLRKPEPGSIKECLSADNHFYELAI
jgi:hypothetical protein